VNDAPAKRPLQLSAGLILLIFLVAVAAGLAALSQYQGGPAIWLRMYSLQSSGPSQACAPPARLVPGSYQAGPVQLVSGFVVLVYTAQCAEAGQPAQGVQGFAALDPQGVGCAGSGQLPPVPSAGAVPRVTIDGVSSTQCGSFDPGGGISIVTGQVSGAGATTVQVTYASGFKAVGPVRQGHFGISAPDASGVCAVRALDDGGALLAQTGMGGLGASKCP
jgi:hypothetical protein